MPSSSICTAVASWAGAVSDRMKKDLAIRALDMAARLRQLPEACIFHSDRGQYCSYDHQKKLQAYGLRPSRSGKPSILAAAEAAGFRLAAVDRPKPRHSRR